MVAPHLLSELIVGVESLRVQASLGTVSTLTKSSREKIQIGYREFVETRYGEVRVWYSSGQDSEKKPSQKGITFKLQLTEHLVNALTDAAKILLKSNNVKMSAIVEGFFCERC